MRLFLLSVGWAFVGLGLIGVFVPGLPTTPFLLVALWAFSKTSKKFHDWLYNHPQLGPPICAWNLRGVISIKAKILAITTILSSLFIVILFVTDDWVLPLIVGAFLLPPALFILTRPSRPSGARH